MIDRAPPGSSSLAAVAMRWMVRMDDESAIGADRRKRRVFPLNNLLASQGTDSLAC